MRALDPALETHLKSGATTLCLCWRVERRDGALLGFTDHDRVVTFDGLAYEPETGADASAIEETADLSVDNGEFAGALTSAKLSDADLAAGKYDGAGVQIWRVNWAAPVQRLLLKEGVIGETKRADGRFTAEFRGAAHALDQPVGRVYQRHCDAILGDARCSVDAAAPAYKGAGVVAAVSGDSAFTASGLSAFADGWFDHGALTWTSGANSGLGAHVKTHGRAASLASLALWLPPGAPLAVGDQFAIIAGCDKRAATCKAKFGNLINFRGFHLMPGNDFAISYPLRTDNNDGGKRS